MDKISDTHWRPMRADDLPAVAAISATVHGDYVETQATYAERLALYPAGCLVLERGGLERGDQVAGFLVSHPWHAGQSPALNERLGAIPHENADYYLHDIALLPQTRGSGAGKAALAFVIAHARARGFERVSLVAVNGADRFWSAQGFDHVETADASPYGPGSFAMQLKL